MVTSKVSPDNPYDEHKFKKYGVSGTAFEWFQSYLFSRKQCCFVNGSLSEDRPLACGIPQGTILGPLLF